VDTRPTLLDTNQKSILKQLFHDGILPSLKWRVVFQYFSVLGGRKEKKRKKRKVHKKRK
jgi:hypothetical protein